MTKITNFVWNPVDDCVISELDGTGSVQAVYTNEPQQYGGVISQRRGTTTSTYHADALGTTRAMTDSTQTTTDTYLYDAWGNLITSSGTTVNPFRWVGRYGYYQDSSTGLVYVRARMYQPTVASWCCADFALFGDGPNLFQYSCNSPLQLIDPSGLFAETTKGCVTKYYTREKDKGFGEDFPTPYETAFHTVKVCTSSDCYGKSPRCCNGNCHLSFSINTVNSGWHVAQTATGLNNSGIYIYPDGPWFPTERDPWPGPGKPSDIDNRDKISWTASGETSFGCDTCIEKRLFFGIKTTIHTDSTGYTLNVRGCCSDCGNELWSSVTMRLNSPRGPNDDIQLRELTGPDDPTRLPSGVEIYERPKLRKVK
jgi:RHS repeat-associated protein